MDLGTDDRWPGFTLQIPLQELPTEVRQPPRNSADRTDRYVVLLIASVLGPL